MIISKHLIRKYIDLAEFSGSSSLKRNTSSSNVPVCYKHNIKFYIMTEELPLIGQVIVKINIKCSEMTNVALP